MKKKLLIVILFCFGCAGIASAVEVINIDLNGYNDNGAYTGTAAVNDGINHWNVYYGGWGKPMGSPRSENLAAYNEPNVSSTYAAQVWIGENGGTNRYYVNDTNNTNLVDGFRNNPGEAGDPNVRLWGQGAYGGTFDVYVYGMAAGSFTLVNGRTGATISTKTVTGGVPAGQFIEGGNYVVFTGVNIVDPNYVFIKYSNVINALQLVKQKSPVPIADGTIIPARDYDVAYETNKRSGESQHFGPDISGSDAYSSYGYVSFLDGSEYMEYDVTMDDAHEGEYRIYGLMDTRNYDAINMDIYFNGMALGTIQAAYTGDPFLSMTNPVTVNIFGSPNVQTLKWKMSAPAYHNIAYYQFEYVGVANMPDCNSVYNYGFNYAGDLNKDCKVNYNDLLLMSQQWLSCNDPNKNNCP